MNENLSRKVISKKRIHNFKVYTGWTQEWIPLKQIGRNRYIDVHEIVRGPFSSPKLIRTRPYIEFPSRRRQLKDVYGDYRDIRRGIPDTWREYLAAKGFCGAAERNMLQKNLITSYVRCLATDNLWNDVGLPFVQGIPDPWKSRSLYSSRRVKCSQRYPRAESGSSARIACTYDGDDEAEIERSVGCQVNKDRFNNKNDLPREIHSESSSRLIEREVCRTYQDNLKRIKRGRRKCINQLTELAISQEESKKKRNINVGTEVDFKNKIDTDQESTNRSTRKHKKEQLDGKRQSSGRKRQNDLDIKTIHEKGVQTVPVETVHKAVCTGVALRGKTEQIEDLFPKTHLDVNPQMWPNILCCNCTLQNYMISNMKCCSNFTIPLKDVSLSNRVLCQDCENIYCKGKQQKSDSIKTKTLKFCTLEPRRYLKRANIYKWTKMQACTCVQKAKKRFKAFGKPRPHTETKNMFMSKQELKLMCYHCNCPYLKIKVANKRTLRNIRSRARNCVRKYPTTRKRRCIVRGSKNRRCTCVGNKSYVSKSDLEQTVKRRNDRDGFVKVNTYDSNILLREIERLKLDKEIQGDIPGTTCCRNFNDNTKDDTKQVSKTTAHCTRLFANNEKEEKGEKGCRKEILNDYHVMKKKKKDDKSNSIVSTSDEKVEVSHFGYSDSGEYADVSGNITNAGFNNTAQDRASVTSITFIQELCNKNLLTKHYKDRSNGEEL
ncbi:uncharacterized protein LOC143426058 [Xylocopa sonorina]|uniref:uncharacterized protein LOC143426058 n=1 Tax=Xylocopa sonorina TaxID=1818115 RepID=UPI00403B17B2